MIGVRVFPFGGPAVIPLCGRNTAGPLRAQAVLSDEDIGYIKEDKKVCYRKGRQQGLL